MILYTDGGCSANWQKDMSKRKMVSVVSDAAGLPIWEKHLQGGSNNIAEIVAVWGALKCCQRMGISTVEIRTDSQNNVAWCKSFRCSTKVNDALTVTNISVCDSDVDEDDCNESGMDTTRRESCGTLH
jgi:ribonuclease HI